MITFFILLIIFMEFTSSSHQQECIQQLLKVPPSHIERGKVQRYLLLNNFPTWKSKVFQLYFPSSFAYYQLLAGFNLLLTGLGSKYNILQEFHDKAMREENCLIVNGFNPSFSLMEFVGILCEELFLFNYKDMRQDIVVYHNDLL